MEGGDEEGKCEKRESLIRYPWQVHPRDGENLSEGSSHSDGKEN